MVLLRPALLQVALVPGRYPNMVPGADEGFAQQPPHRAPPTATIERERDDGLVAPALDGPTQNREPVALLAVPEPNSFAVGSALLSNEARLTLLEALPVSVLVIDRQAVVRFANRRTGEMLAMSCDEIHGRNVLDFVLLDDVDFAAELLDAGTAYVGEIIGPSRMRYVDSLGVTRWTQVWASEAPPELGIDGFVVTLTSESVRDLLVSAVGSLAVDDELDRTLEAVALSARARPLGGAGAILKLHSCSIDDAVRFRAIGQWPLDDAALDAHGTPWKQVLATGEHADVDDVATSELPSGIRDALLGAGVRSLFVRLIRDGAHELVGVYVVFRPDRGPATLNQDDHLHDAVRLASLAFAQTRRRTELESAALTDALTGVPNRSAFNHRLETERRHADVLFVDLDHFKSVNDTLGHGVGDLVIAAAAQRIEHALRRTDTVYRTGGDEFVVVCEPTGEDPRQRIALAERIIDDLTAPFEVGDHRVEISATIGIAQAEGNGLSATVRAADGALYAAKQQGRAGWNHST